MEEETNPTTFVNAQRRTPPPEVPLFYQTIFGGINGWPFGLEFSTPTPQPSLIEQDPS